MKFPVPTWVGEDGHTYYDQPHEPREEFTIRVRTDGVFFLAHCDQVPGVNVSGTSLDEVLRDMPLAIKTIRELDATKP